jgi:hypothetical protein
MWSKKTDAGFDPVPPRAVQVNLQGNVSFIGLACNCGGAVGIKQVFEYFRPTLSFKIRDYLFVLSEVNGFGTQVTG